jgi:DNA repair protein RadC
VFHNHPSGDASPSREDFELTGRLADAGRNLGVDLVDHMILADASYFSMRDARKFRELGGPL